MPRESGAAADQRGAAPSVPKGKGSPWTILCSEFRGGYALENAEGIAETLRRTPDVNPKSIRVEHEPDGYSRVYYGTYLRRADPKSGKRTVPAELQRDLTLIRELTGPAGERYFAGARVVRLPLPDVGNPEWVLTKSSGAYSLQVAAFEPDDDFWDYKSSAAEFCEWLRGKGYEAWYYHGPSVSIVTVGSFPRSAVIQSDLGLPRYSAEVLAMQRDELLRYNLVNGAVIKARSVDPESSRRVGADSSTGNPDAAKLQPVPSRLVPVPRDGHSLGPT